VRELLRRVRAYPAVNRVVTTSGRAAARAARRLSAGAERHLPRTGVVRSRLPNGCDLVMESHGDEPWSNALFWRGWDGFYEPETVPAFFALAARARVTLDIGANIGIFTVLAGHANGAARVFAFEPDPRAFRRLVRHVELNELTNVSCEPVAVGDVYGEVVLYAGIAAHPDETVAVSAQTSVARPHVEAEGMRVEHIDEVHAHVVTVDGFVAAHDLPAIDLVKIDVERAEAMVLAGMHATLERDRPSILCEVLDADAGRVLEEILRPFDYRWYHLTWAGPVQRDQIVPVGGGLWPNYLFTTLSLEELTYTG
jgi:FkbM family methyltransferase